MSTQEQIKTVNPFQEVSAGMSTEMPPRLVIYGRGKIGKTTFACDAPDPFLIDIENGAKYLAKKVRATPHLQDYDSIILWLRHIYEDDKFTCKTIVIDSLDHAEEMAQTRLIKQNNAKSITDPAIKAFAYHKGVSDAASDTIAILRWLDAIYRKKGIKAIIVAHSTVKEIDLPGRDPFARYQLKLSKQLAAKTMEWADILLHAEYDFHVSTEGKTSEPKAVLFTGGDMSYEGGGRIKLPKQIPISYAELEKAIIGKSK